MAYGNKSSKKGNKTVLGKKLGGYTDKFAEHRKKVDSNTGHRKPPKKS